MFSYTEGAPTQQKIILKANTQNSIFIPSMTSTEFISISHHPSHLGQRYSPNPFYLKVSLFLCLETERKIFTRNLTAQL